MVAVGLASCGRASPNSPAWSAMRIPLASALGGRRRNGKYAMATLAAVSPNAASSCGRKLSRSTNIMSNTMARGFWAARPSSTSTYTARDHGQRPASFSRLARLFSSMLTSTMSGSGVSAVAWRFTNASSSRFSSGFIQCSRPSSSASPASTATASRDRLRLIGLPGPPDSSSVQDVLQGVEQVHAGVDLVAVDRDALDVHAQGYGIGIGAVEDAAQVVAADLDRALERPRRAEDRALGFRRDVDAERSE